MASRKPKERKSLEAAAGAVFFLLLGLGVVWFAKAVADVTSSAILSVLVIMPALLYVILRGNLRELRGPAGWAATFKVTNDTVSFALAQKLDGVTLAQIVPKGNLADLHKLTRRLDRYKPVLMTISLSEHYDVQAMLTYLGTLIDFPKFRIVIFLNSSGQFVGCAGSSNFYSLVQKRALANEFLAAVGQGSEDELFQYPGILKYHIHEDETNAEALRIMNEHGLGVLAVVDKEGHAKGIIEREQLMSKLILSLIKDATED